MAEADPNIEAAPKPVEKAAPAPQTSGMDAAAILMMLLGDKEAADVLSRLEPTEVQQLGAAMFGVSDVTEDQIDGALNLFMSRAQGRTSIGVDVAPKIRTVMETALGAERAENVLARISPPTRSGTLDALQWMDPRTIAALIEHEHPQISALVLSQLEPATAADVLDLLPKANQPDIIYRVATLESVSAEAFEDLERVLTREHTRTAAAPAIARGGATEAAKIMNNMRPGQDQQIIKSVAKLDKTLAQNIQDEMFVFGNLIDVDDKSLGTLLRSVESETLVVALKGADDRLREKILGCMSKRAAETIVDEMEERGPIRLAEVLEAQKEVLAVARKLADAGTIQLSGRGDDYV